MEVNTIHLLKCKNFRLIYRIPYDWRNPIGYLVITLYHYISLQQICGFLGLGATLGVGALLLGITTIRDMKIVLKSTNNNAIAGEENKVQALKKLNEFIEIHGMVKELSEIYTTVHTLECFFLFQSYKFLLI